MKERLKDWITSIFGAMLLGISCVMIVLNAMNKVDFSLLETLSLASLGYVFLTAKDSLIEGITLGLLRVKK